MKKVGIILSGCGVFDGSEIHEAICTLLALSEQGLNYECLAPNIEQQGVVNHVTKSPSSESRNVLVESARIARGAIKDLAIASPMDYSAIILPGGFGAAKNLSTFAIESETFSVHPVVEKFLRQAHQHKIPMAFLCIAPVIAAKLFGNEKVTLTIGNDDQTLMAMKKCGANHQSTAVDEISVDSENKIISTACYMLATNIAEIHRATTKVVAALKKWL